MIAQLQPIAVGYFMPDVGYPPLLREILPSLVRELEELLLDQGEDEIAGQVPELRIHDHCRCGDSFCGTFFVGPKPNGSYGPHHRNVSLSPKEGMLILDVVDERIVCVEALYRDDVRKAIHAVGS